MIIMVKIINIYLISFFICLIMKIGSLIKEKEKREIKKFKDLLSKIVNKFKYLKKVC